MGAFPWVADLSSCPTTQSGIKPNTDLTKTGIQPGMVYLEGYLKIPKDGMYQFSMYGNGSYVLRLHEALVLDRSSIPISLN
ncbi:PA14 domain-containing protein [Spirosoma aerolatum]|uniref:hypothetical protein n=1 Tax=Spirosoma aerolatum TaxID=1211326 RepID=UPI0009AEE324|nr:hypothetical protein [Spirosoma aerolatum]